MTTFGQRLVQSAKEALAIARGEMEPARTYTPADLEAARVGPVDVDVAAIRKRLGLSQVRFAQRFGFSVGIVRDWEQGRRCPDRIARTLLLVISREPEAVQRALDAA